MPADFRVRASIRAAGLCVACLMPAIAAPAAGEAQKKPNPAPTPIATPVPPERVPASQKKGAVSERRIPRFENPSVSFSKISRVEEVDLDNDGVAEALVEGIGTVRSLAPDIPAVGFVSRTRLPFENPILAVFSKGKGASWDVLLVAHLPLACSQSDDAAKCDELLAFRSVRFRFDDRPQVALQIVHAGEPHLSETRLYRLDRGRLEETFSIAAPRMAVDVVFGPEGVTRRIAVDTFINKELPPRYRSFTLTTNYVFGDRKFRVLSESVDPEWNEHADTELSYWGLVHQSTFAADLTRLQERQKSTQGETLDPAEIVRKRFADARDVRVGVKQSGVAVVYFERVGCPAHVVVYQPLRQTDGEKAFWDFAVIRAADEPAYECLAEPPMKGE